MNFDKIIDELVDKYSKYLYYTALRMTKSPEAAEDLVQDTFMKAYRSLPGLGENPNYKPWLYKIMYTSFISDLRKKNVRIDPTYGVEFSDMSANSQEEFVYDEVTDNFENLLELVDDQVKNAIDDLPAEFRMVFLLVTVNDLTYQEASEILECPVGTVMSRLYRAKGMLKKNLLDYGQKMGYKRNI